MPKQKTKLPAAPKRTLAQMERAAGFGPTLAPIDHLRAMQEAYQWAVDHLDRVPRELLALRDAVERNLGKDGEPCC